MSSKENGQSDPSASRCSLALVIAIAMTIALTLTIVGGLLVLVGYLIYAAWCVNWSIGVVVAVFVLLVAIPDGTAEECGENPPW